MIPGSQPGVFFCFLGVGKRWTYSFKPTKKRRGELTKTNNVSGTCWIEVYVVLCLAVGSDKEKVEGVG